MIGTAADSRTLSFDRTSLLGLRSTVVATAFGVFVVAAADALSRTGLGGASLTFWIGTGLIFVPTTIAQLAPDMSRGERLGRLLLLGAALYLVKVMRDPFGYTYADELVHQYNVQQILSTGKLFQPNPILAVTPSYPGLEAATAAFSRVTGFSTFVSGMVLIGVARIVLMLGLFLLYEQLADSARVAAVAATLYTVSPHYIFFIADFSYESLSLPLFVVVLYGIVRGWLRPSPQSRRFRILVALVAPVIVVTHHMTSYALFGLLLLLCALPPWSRAQLRGRPWRLLVFVFGVTAAWLAFVARQTVGYLTPVLSDAIVATFQTASGEASPRQLFHPSGTGGTTTSHRSFLELGVAVGGTLVILVAIPAGILICWRRRQRDPFTITFALMSLAYLVTLGLRFVPAAWETAVRSSEFLFIGVALIVAIAAVATADRLRRWNALWTAAAAAAAALLLIAGIIAGSSEGGRLAQPYRLDAGGTVVVSPPAAVARWAATQFPPGTRVAPREADARLTRVSSGSDVFAGTNPPIDSVLETPQFYRWQFDLLRRLRIRYIVVDARVVSGDVTSGYFFERTSSGEERFSADILAKFRRAGARPVYDNGDIVVYDLESVRASAAQS
jgi:hypothetical protein